MPTDQQQADTTPQADDAAAQQQQLGFASEFRELARQRRFQRTPQQQAAGDVTHDEVIPPPPGRARKRRAAAPPEATPAAAAALHQPRTRAALPPLDAPAAPGPRPRMRDAYADGQGLSPGSSRARLTDDARGIVTEMARMADRIVEAREALAVERARANRAERDLQAANERIMAARALVHEAQRTARAAVERCAYVEGRCEALEEALDMALNASVLQRWRWRRRVRSGD